MYSLQVDSTTQPIDAADQKPGSDLSSLHSPAINTVKKCGFSCGVASVYDGDCIGVVGWVSREGVDPSFVADHLYVLFILLLP